MRVKTVAKAAPALVLVSLALFLCAPGLLVAWSLVGGSLGLATTGNGWQRDLRIINNSADLAANNNALPEAAYPGALGAPLAIWKAARGWASDNPLAAQNFDFDWQGVTTVFESADSNLVSWDSAACSGGVLAYCELPISDGWNIVMCDNWTWSDGPGSPSGGQFDIQGVATHELGHALGLGHSTVNCGTCSVHATMCAAICGSGVSERTITPDDQAGLQAVYGAIPANKPVITSLAGSTTTLQTLVINGTGFPATVHVKFTASTSQNIGAIPGLVTNVPSAAGGTQVSVVIPYWANDGNVIVWDPVAGVTSNAFPIDVAYVPPPPPPAPQIAGLAPASVTAFGGGPVTITGSGFTGTTLVHLGAANLTLPFGFSVVNDTTIVFNAPTAAALGPAAVSVDAPGGASNAMNLVFVETLPPKLVASPQALSNVQFNWNYGAGSNDVVVLIASLDPTTFDFGTPFQFLLNFTVIGQNVAGPAGTGSFSLVLPPGLAGVTFFSQVGAVDDVTSAIAGSSNLTATTILF
jgi:Matrixin/IPT/TIG domain